ncbi:MAG TPA: pyruvate dehydrogenase [Bdellovibrionota bacterium]|jgi:pyruvate dehydrogenase E1 component|nr:pyruvate dehydrogenase [Bdellovibrionota bacterium]
MSKNPLSLAPAPQNPGSVVLERIIRRIQAHAMTMIHIANNREDVQKGDPKVGGHPSACSSALHLLSLLHLYVKNPQDYFAIKPHASPVDHSNNYLMRLLFEKDGSRMSDDRQRQAMKNLRHFSHSGEPVFQSYHSAFDPDNFGFLPSGSVGIPPVNALYLAHAYQMAEKHGFDVPQDPHFWCLMGDSEFREGSLIEAMPEAAERGIGNLTWILDYNRQSLDGHRVINEDALGGHDSDRVEGTARANGWDVIHIRHGALRTKVFKDSPHGESLQTVLESALPDYELQSLLAKNDAQTFINAVGKYDQGAAKVLKDLDEKSVVGVLRDLGGHDIEAILEAFSYARTNSNKPTFIIAHTIKGWNLQCAAQSGNHSALMEDEEIFDLRTKSGIEDKDIYSFARFDEKSAEGKYLKERGEWLADGIGKIKTLKENNLKALQSNMSAYELQTKFPSEVGINLKFVPLIHTQWMLGQVTAKINRIADTGEDAKKPLTDAEKRWKPVTKYFTTMAPDVGTSTNLNASMDGKIFGPESSDFENQYGVKDAKTPDLIPHEVETSRHVRFDIAECNVMSCAGSYGKMGEFAGVPFLPIMSVYDFFIKRALDQYFYNAYWNASFIVMGTPAGITLSPEGAQHAWKSDIQIANSITWEPTYAVEMDWVLTETAKRHFITAVEGEDHPESNKGRAAVIIRGVTRALEQKELLTRLKTHKRFEGKKDEEMLELTRQDFVKGGWYLVDHRGKPGYRPGENVVNLFAMGAMASEALVASDMLLKEGLFANVVMVSSPDLLLGNLADKDGYQHLKSGLGITGDLYLSVNEDRPAAATSTEYPPKNFGPTPGALSQVLSLGGRRIPVVSVHDGEPGLLDNIGSILGTLQNALSVRKHSKSGRPVDIYAYHGVDGASVAEAAVEILKASAFSEIKIDAALLPQLQSRSEANA